MERVRGEKGPQKKKKKTDRLKLRQQKEESIVIDFVRLRMDLGNVRNLEEVLGSKFDLIF